MVLIAIAMLPAASFAGFISGSTGADGDFTPTANTVLQIPDSGVFNFGTINIPSGVTVTFTKNSANTPVTILAIGDVMINGTINVNGSNGSYIVGGVGGPGGFDGGVGGTTNQVGKRGAGPGSGGGGSPYSNASYCAAGGGGGGFATSGGVGGGQCVSGGGGGVSYGNERILPLIGGSGGGGGGGSNTYVAGAGGGGGGAILIASSGTITVNGSITANGGSGALGDNNGYGGGGGGGGGGAIRLIANTLSGNGTISASGGSGAVSYNNYGNGGGGSAGRIRLEASSMLRTAATTPPYSLGYPYAVIPTGMPVLSIVSIGGISPPSGPKGLYSSPDIMLPSNTQNPVSIVFAGSNIPVGTIVTVKSTPSVGTQTTATANLSGTDPSSTTATASLNISYAYPSIITASVTFQLSAAGIGPIYAQGERVDRIRVATSLGGKSTTTYITESGREIPALL